MAQTLATLRVNLLNRKKDISDVPDATFIQWCNQIADFAYDHIKGIDPERYLDQSNTFTVATQPQTSALPSDFQDIRGGAEGFFEINNDGKDTTIRLNRTGFGRFDAGYYIQGTNVVFTGMENSTRFRLRYSPQRTRFTDTTDFFTLDTLTTGADIVPAFKDEYIVDALDVRYTVWDEEPSAEAFADQRFIRSLDQLLTHIKKEPYAFQIQDFTQSF